MKICRSACAAELPFCYCDSALIADAYVISPPILYLLYLECSIVTKQPRVAASSSHASVHLGQLLSFGFSSFLLG